MSFTTQLPAAQEYVYVIHATGTNRIKLGYTTNPQGRLAALQTASPFPLQMLACWPGSRAREKRLHRYMAQFRQVGEWFEVPPFVGLKLWELVTKGNVTGEVKKSSAVKAEPRVLAKPTQYIKRSDDPKRPCVEAVKASVGTWNIRLRWWKKSAGTRPVRYVCKLTDSEYQEARRNWLAFKNEILAKYYSPEVDA